jgi:hypothetical protein
MIRTCNFVISCIPVAMLAAACAGAVNSIPADVTLAECVTAGALKKEPLAQIADECKADIPAVIAALISVEQKAPQVVATPAYGEARRTLSLSIPPDAGK